MTHLTGFDFPGELWLTPVPGPTAALPAQTDCATEQLLCDLFFEALTFPGYPPRHRHAGLYDPWLRVAETRPPHLSSLDAGPCPVPGGGHAAFLGGARWLRAGAFELSRAA